MEIFEADLSNSIGGIYPAGEIVGDILWKFLAVDHAERDSLSLYTTPAPQSGYGGSRRGGWGQRDRKARADRHATTPAQPHTLCAARLIGYEASRPARSLEAKQLESARRPIQALPTLANGSRLAPAARDERPPYSDTLEKCYT